ncbi:hypothetical protein BST81_07275 [Leptolyngbya sp. 'hensonii']|nr:hypothetical protein BST81_07275 [Leptolyngbya sp. 'hensonii']
MTRQSHIISTVLAPAIGLWLRSQAEQIDNLQVNIEGGDRQILSGCLPQVTVAACPAVYQGLHLSDIKISASGIRINLGQILKGKPLRLLEPIAVTADLMIRAEDLNLSLQGPLLANAMVEFLAQMVRSGQLATQGAIAPDALLNLKNLQIQLQSEQLQLRGELLSDPAPATPVTIQMGVQRISEHELEFNQLRLVMAEAAPVESGSFRIDLGTDVKLEELTLAPDHLTCRGLLTVNP